MNTSDFPGKPSKQRFCKLHFLVEPVLVINSEPCDPKQVENASDHLDKFSELQFQIHLNKECVFTCNFYESKKFLFTKFLDDLEERTWELAIKLDGKENKHTWNCNLNQSDITMAVQVNFEIENLPMQSLLSEVASYFTNSEVKKGSVLMGENGCQILYIDSPIYPWLLKHKNLINLDLKTLS